MLAAVKWFMAGLISFFFFFEERKALEKKKYMIASVESELLLTLLRNALEEGINYDSFG